MPSPVAHLAAGFTTYQIATQWSTKIAHNSAVATRELLILAAVYSLLPDADAILGILSGDFRRYHNNATHSIAAGIVAALLVAWWVQHRNRRQRGQQTGEQRRQAGLWFLVALSCYLLHILMDAATLGRGVLLLWPFSGERIQFPVIFYGVRWSQGILAWSHLWTIFTELAFAAILTTLTRLGLGWLRSTSQTATSESTNH